MKVELNGREAELPNGARLADVLALLELDREARGVAVALDAEVIPRGEWGELVISPGARIEVLTAFQGG